MLCDEHGYGLSIDVDQTSAGSCTTSGSAGADVRMRWSKALSEAVAPAPSAMTICLNGTVVQSPAANTPGMLVRP